VYSCRGLAFVKEHVVPRTRRGHDARVDKYDKLCIIVCVCESLFNGGENAALKVRFIWVKYAGHSKKEGHEERKKPGASGAYQNTVIFFLYDTRM